MITAGMITPTYEGKYILLICLLNFYPCICVTLTYNDNFEDSHDENLSVYIDVWHTFSPLIRCVWRVWKDGPISTFRVLLFFCYEPS